MKSINFIISLILLMTLFLILNTARASVVLNFDHYFDGSEVMKALHDLHHNFPGLTDLRSIGRSEEGRDIWLLMINNSKTGADTDKPGIYVDGTIHGNEIQATEVCLYLAWYLLDSYAKVPEIKELVDSRAFYIIPVVNVDSRWRFFSEPTSYDCGRSARVPFDDDHDGLVDEDPCEDLDGDGEILTMRIRDSFGGFKSHPDDPRVMIPVKPGELSEWKIIGMEGIDNDEDGRLNEDWPGYLDMNRNYGFKWQPPYIQDGAGDYPMSGKITKAISDFIITKPNISFNIAFHNWGGLFVRGPSSKMAERYFPQDIKVYDYLGKEAERIIPGYRYVSGYKEMYTTYGDFDEWMFSCLGIFGFVGEIFMGNQESFRSPHQTDSDQSQDEQQKAYWSGTPADERQKFNDNLTHGTMFKDWKTFQHPQYGEVEIGGWRPFTTRTSPPFMLLETVHRNAATVIFFAKQAPDIDLETIDIVELDNNIYRIRVRVSNKNAIPTLSSRALQYDLTRRDQISIEGKSISVLTGGIIEDLIMNKVSQVEHRPYLIFTHVPTFGKQDIQWIVKGSGIVTISYNSVKAQNKTIKLTL